MFYDRFKILFFLKRICNRQMKLSKNDMFFFPKKVNFYKINCYKRDLNYISVLSLSSRISDLYLISTTLDTLFRSSTSQTLTSMYSRNFKRVFHLIKSQIQLKKWLGFSRILSQLSKAIENLIKFLSLKLRSKQFRLILVVISVNQ